MQHYLSMSAPDAVARVHTAFAGNNVQEQRDWARNTLQNSAALELISTRVTHSSAVDVDLMSRLLTTRAYEIREMYEEDRSPLWFLDWFMEAGLMYPLQPGTLGLLTRSRDYQAGEVRFIGDKTVDWPTSGHHADETTVRQVKHFGKAVEYGLLELWQTVREGRDIVAERIREALYDIDTFLDTMIAQGAPMHGIFGFIGHPDIPVSVFPPTATPPGLATQWPLKTPTEVLFDLNTARNSSRIDSNYNSIANAAIISDIRHDYINAAEIGVAGDTILSRWLKNQETSPNGGMKRIMPFPPYNAAGPGGTPQMTVGNFTMENIEFPMMPATMTPTEYHGAQWKIGFVGACSSVNVKRKGRFRTFTGI